MATSVVIEVTDLVAEQIKQLRQLMEPLDEGTALCFSAYLTENEEALFLVVEGQAVSAKEVSRLQALKSPDADFSEHNQE